MGSKNPLAIVITGATKGLGRAMVEKFAALGHTVVGCGRSKDAIAALSEQFPAPHLFTALDVANDRDVANWAKQALATAGAPDVLINNAALINRNARLWEISDEEFSNVIDVNLKGVANVIRHFVPAMVQRGSGTIVNFSSGWGRSADRDVAPYCATKWGIEGLTRALAEELPKGMVAVPLNPGVINTEMLQTTFGAHADQYPSPERWAESAVPQILGFTAKDNGQPLAVHIGANAPRHER